MLSSCVNQFAQTRFAALRDLYFLQIAALRLGDQVRTFCIGTNKKKILLQVEFSLKMSYLSVCGVRSGSVVEFLTRDQGVAGSSLTGGTVLCP